MPSVPGGWRRFTLSDITLEEAERVGGRRGVTVLSSTKHLGLVPSDEYFKNRSVYSSNLSGYRVVRRGWFAYATNHLAEGSIGLQQDFELACVSPIYTVFSCTDEVYPPYLFRVLKSPDLIAKYGVHEQASVDRRGAVRYRDFSRIEVALPPQQDQRRIVEILDTIEDQIANQRLVVEKTSHITAALIEAELRRITGLAASTASLGSVATVATGVTLGTETGGTVEVPYLRVANVQDGYIDTTEVKSVRVSKSDAQRYMLRAGDVLLTEGGDFDKLGRGAVWDARIDPCICQNHIFRVRCDRSRLLPAYLAAYTSSNQGKQYFLSIAKQTTNLATINSRQLKAMPVPIPPLEAQHELLSLLAAQKTSTSTEGARLHQLILLRHGLTEDLLTGRIRVAEAGARLEDV
ncbi:restriction endonuclease subunit S [Micromonospora chalcea]|uniref:restriction endonuclease subunit S n=1 Tax=Micromonospora chalcea TaxID=1874 RepID=UPI0023784AE9|nr:restriction endonuclease subunit S [Micromonospora chalcea]WDQ02213.1 restriction endonuclease subunit S [Micromonospora chalcea]